MRLRLIVFVAASVTALSTASPALAQDCGNAGKGKDVVATDVACVDAKKVVKRWVRLCNFGGKCQVEDVPGVDERYICRGPEKKGRLNITCRAETDGSRIRFNVAA